MDLTIVKQRFGIIGNNDALNRALEVALRVAPTDLSVLVTGESGVGKEFFPQIIHANSSRKHGNYIAVNCGAIPDGTIDSELFGHEKGAFTGATESRKGYFEVADGGTIFLDEVAELPHNIRQLKNVAEQISAIEPTRTITGEILRRYLPAETERSGVPMLTEPSAAKDRSDERELLYKVLFDLRNDMNDVKRMLAELIAERKYEAPKSDIAALLPRSNYPVTSPVRPAEEIFTDTEEVIDEPPHEEMTKEKAQREAIVRALRHHGGKRRDAARELFISERTLYRKMKELGIDDSCIKP